MAETFDGSGLPPSRLPRHEISPGASRVLAHFLPNIMKPRTRDKWVSEFIDELVELRPDLSLALKFTYTVALREWAACAPRHGPARDSAAVGQVSIGERDAAARTAGRRHRGASSSASRHEDQPAEPAPQDRRARLGRESMLSVGGCAMG
jgi:hypothetical protein